MLALQRRLGKQVTYVEFSGLADELGRDSNVISGSHLLSQIRPGGAFAACPSSKSDAECISQRKEEKFRGGRKSGKGLAGLYPTAWNSSGCRRW